MTRTNHTLHYTPLFCEENIWKLLQSFYTDASYLKTVTPIDVLFIINKLDSIALFNQKKSTSGLPVIWDYHVVLSARLNNISVIYDFDSICRFPATIDSYFQSTFPSHIQLKDEFQPYLRVIGADSYYRQFRSDRSHMAGIIPESRFPDYDIIKSQNKQNSISLQAYKNIRIKIKDTQLVQPHQYLVESVK